MQRDIDVIRRILGEVEASSSFVRYGTLLEAHQVAVMKDAGLLDADLNTNGSGLIVFATVFRLTWTGHDFLDAARDDTIWKKAKDKVIKPGFSWTFSLLLEVLKSEAKNRLGIP